MAQDGKIVQYDEMLELIGLPHVVPGDHLYVSLRDVKRFLCKEISGKELQGSAKTIMGLWDQFRRDEQQRGMQNSQSQR